MWRAAPFNKKALSMCSCNLTVCLELRFTAGRLLKPQQYMHLSFCTMSLTFYLSEYCRHARNVCNRMSICDV